MIKILLADDSLIMHRAVKLCLKKEPFEVITTDNGKDALSLIHQHKPAVVLADLDMPGLNGSELCQAVRQDPRIRDTKFVLLCGAFEQVDETRLSEIPADGRLWKPFEAHVLISLLASLLKSPATSSTGSNPAPQIAAEPTGPIERPSSSVVESFTPERDDFAESLTKQTFHEAESKPGSFDVDLSSYPSTGLADSAPTPKSASAYEPTASTVAPFPRVNLTTLDEGAPTLELQRPELNPTPKVSAFEPTREISRPIVKEPSELTSDQLWGALPEEVSDLYDPQEDNELRVTEETTAESPNPFASAPSISIPSEKTEEFLRLTPSEIEPFDFVQKEQAPALADFQINQWMDDSDLKTAVSAQISLPKEPSHVQIQKPAVPAGGVGATVSLNEDQIRAIVREEFEKAFNRNLKSVLEEQLIMVMAEIDSA